VEIEIENIVVKSNPRTDFGDIDELTASVREKGILEPLIVKEIEDGKVELVAGERRLRAGKSAGLKKVPVVFYGGDEVDVEEVKLIENMHRKDLNPVEESKAFNSYIETTKTSVDTLAQKISKPKLYIERRLELLKLPEDVKKALSDRKILLGHALVIARLTTKSEQKKLMKEIINDKLSVNHAEREVRRMDSTVELSDAIFNKSDCKGCGYNGGEQSMLFETGSEIKGFCLNKKCFHKKTLQHIKEETKKLKDKGINVLTKKQLEKVKSSERVYNWDNDFKDIKKRLHKEPQVFAIVFMDRYGSKIEKEIHCINPRKRHSKKAKVTDEKVKDQNAKDRLNNKVSDFKRNFLIGKTQDLIQPSTKETKTMTLFALLVEGRDWNDKNKMEVTEKIIEDAKLERDEFDDEFSFSKILALDESEIDRLIAKASGMWVKHLHDELSEASETFGVNLTEHFTITEEYLKPYTKLALIELAKEIGLSKHLEESGIEKWEKAKRTELVDYFLNKGFDLKGKVPKLMQKAR